MAPTSNRLLPILGIIVVSITAFVGLRSCSGSEPSDTDIVMDTVPTAPGPDADTPADTIKTLTANVGAMTRELEQLRRDNAQLLQENQRLATDRRQIEERVTARVRQALRSQADASPRGVDSGAFATLSDRVDRLARAVEQQELTTVGRDIPVGFGFEAPAVNPELVWIEPLGQGEGDGWLDRAGRTAEGYLDRAEPAAHTANSEPRAVYTVPRNATLIGATAMTALVGRIPVDGEVRDPMPFKVITGAENLAANGLTIPGVHGMIWSGTAIGDWTLACVTGQLESVTFVFDDGTIRTISSDDRSNPTAGQERDRPLGWISDAQGIPCVTGARKTNAPAFLAQRLGVSALEAAGEAAAAAETTSVVGSNGTVTDRVSGDLERFVMGRSLADGSDEVAAWLAERAAQSFDAVFVPAGRPLAIHVDRELAIDFDPSGRRLHHVADDQRPHRLD